MGLIQDLLMLQRTNLTICSFTSNVRRGGGGPLQICRMVYEVQEARGAEGGQVESLEVLGGLLVPRASGFTISTRSRGPRWR